MLYPVTKVPKVSPTDFNKSVTVIVETHTGNRYAYYDMKKEQWINNETGAVIEDVMCWFYGE